MVQLVLTTEETRPLSDSPILILDKKGILGVPLATRLSEAFLTIIVTGKEITQRKNIILLPFHTRVPKIPNNTFSHIVIVYNGEKILHAMLPSIIKKAKHDNATLLFIMARVYAKGPFVKELMRRHEKTVIVLFGDVFGEKAYDRSLVTTLLSEAVNTGKMTLPGNGLTSVFPIHFTDLIQLLLEVFFTTHTKPTVYAFFPKHPVTALSFARMVTARFPELKIDFHQTKKEDDRFIELPPGTIHMIEPARIRSRLKDISLTAVTSPTVRFFQAEKGTRRRRFTGRKAISMVFLSLMLFIGMPLVTAGVGFASLFAGQSDIKAGNIQSAKKKVAFAKQTFVLSGKVVVPIGIAARLVGAGKEASYMQGYITTGEKAAGTIYTLVTAAELLQTVYRGESNSPTSDFTTGLRMLQETRTNLKDLVKDQHIPAKERKQIGQVLLATTLLDETADVLPTVFGFRGKREYLVLLQNNFELRPGGGFIGSYAIATVEKGRLVSFKIQDVYDADGQLKVQIEPPYFLRRYVGIKNWYLRDSNTDIDFPKNAANAASFLQKETGEKVDGVIGVDVYLMQKLLGVFGGVKVSEFNTTVTSDTFFRLAEKHAEDNFFPGSTQKKDFLRAVANSTLSELTENKTVPYLSLLDAVNSAFAEKHLLIVTLDQTIQKVFTTNNLSGSIQASRSTNRMRQDVFTVSEANIGLNKVNYYLRRRTEQRLTFGETGDMTGLVTLLYTNTSKKGDKYGGAYVNYAQILLPKNTELTEIAFNGVEQEIFAAVTDPRQYESPRFVAPIGIEVAKSDTEQGTLFGFLIRVPEGESQKVTVTYTVAQVYDPQSMPYTYVASFIKQPGTAEDPYIVTITYPEALIPLKTEGINKIGNALVLQDTLTTDKKISVTFGK